jgi:hypothetical protein
MSYDELDNLENHFDFSLKNSEFECKSSKVSEQNENALVSTGFEAPLPQGQVLCSEYFFEVDREYFNSQENVDENFAYFEDLQTENNTFRVDPFQKQNEPYIQDDSEKDELVRSYLSDGVVTIVCDEVLNENEELSVRQNQEVECEQITEIVLSGTSTKENNDLMSSSILESNFEEKPSLKSSKLAQRNPNLKKSIMLDLEISLTKSYIRKMND